MRKQIQLRLLTLCCPMLRSLENSTLLWRINVVPGKIKCYIYISPSWDPAQQAIYSGIKVYYMAGTVINTLHMFE